MKGDRKGKGARPRAPASDSPPRPEPPADYRETFIPEGFRDGDEVTALCPRGEYDEREWLAEGLSLELPFFRF